MAAAVDQHPGVSIEKQISIDERAGQSAGTPSSFGVSHVSFGVIVTNTGDITDHVVSRTPPQAATASTATTRSGKAAAPVSILPLAVSQHPTSSPSPHRPGSAPRRTPPRCVDHRVDATSLLSIGHTAFGRAEPTYGTITNFAPSRPLAASDGVSQMAVVPGVPTIRPILNLGRHAGISGALAPNQSQRLRHVAPSGPNPGTPRWHTAEPGCRNLPRPRGAINRSAASREFLIQCNAPKRSTNTSLLQSDLDCPNGCFPRRGAAAMQARTLVTDRQW
jgi:hypothetical protein